MITSRDCGYGRGRGRAGVADGASTVSRTVLSPKGSSGLNALIRRDSPAARITAVIMKLSRREILRTCRRLALLKTDDACGGPPHDLRQGFLTEEIAVLLDPGS